MNKDKPVVLHMVDHLGVPYDLVLRPTKRKTKQGWPVFRSVANGGHRQLWYRNLNNGRIYHYPQGEPEHKSLDPMEGLRDTFAKIDAAQKRNAGGEL